MCRQHGEISQQQEILRKVPWNLKMNYCSWEMMRSYGWWEVGPESKYLLSESGSAAALHLYYKVTSEKNQVLTYSLKRFGPLIFSFSLSFSHWDSVCPPVTSSSPNDCGSYVFRYSVIQERYEAYWIKRRQNGVSQTYVTRSSVLTHIYWTQKSCWIPALAVS